ncbi:MAG: hypothetical protein ACM3ZC_15790 [Bacteroidota bacterium]
MSNRLRMAPRIALPAVLIVLAGCVRLWGGGSAGSARPNKVARPRVSAQLLAVFPQRVGTVWRYDGYAEYGHEMQLRAVRRSAGKVVHEITGAVADVSSGESTRDFRFALQYVFHPDEVRERILRADTPFPHRLGDLVLLRLPLKQGSSWRQTVRAGGRAKSVQAVILAAGERDGAREYTVRYRTPMAGKPGGVYEEIRVFRAGVGVVWFENTFGSSPEERFNYALFAMERR